MKSIYKILIAAVASVALFTTFFVSCAGDNNEVKVKSVTLSKTSLTLTEGDSETLTATILPNDAVNSSVEWSSSDASVASVANGRVTAIKAGTATITVITEDGGKTATCAVTVKAKTISVTGVSLDKTTLSLTEGETAALAATVAPENATNKNVTWKSGDTAVATVDSNGKVTAVKAGNATITVTTEDGAKTATCAVTVTAATVAVTEVTLNKTVLSLVEGTNETLMAIVQPENATNKNVTWKSSNTATATVDANGKVTAVKAGNATITVTTEDGGKTATCAVTVTTSAVPVTGVTLNKTSLSLTEGASETLTATVAPATATNKNVTWKSSNTATATVDANGKVTAVKAGNATITVTTEDGGKTATCAVTVTSATVAVTEVTLNKTILSLVEGTNETLTATIQPENATNKNVTWKSSNTATATVDANGKVTAVKAGNATITVTTEDGGKTATCAVTVTTSAVPVTGVTLNKTSLSLTEEASETLTATVAPATATNKNVTWKSSNTATATVDANGKVTAVKAGNATITVTTEDGGKTATCAVTVTAAKPVITSHPEDTTVEAGQTATFSVTATGAKSYQWQRSANGGTSWGNVANLTGSVSGAKTATLSVVAASDMNGHLYRCMVSNDTGGVISNTATLTVTAAIPVITAHPADAAIAPGGTATFSITATGATSYRWQVSTDGGVNFYDAVNNVYNSGVTTQTLTVTDFASVGVPNGNFYRCVAFNDAGSATSNPATLTITSGDLPVITSHPVSVTKEVGETATFSVTATGATSYQWQLSDNSGATWDNVVTGGIFSGATTATLTYANVSADANGWQFRCVVSNDAGSVNSNAATLTIAGSFPVITSHPVSVTKEIGETATFSVTATGATSYRWQQLIEGGSWSDLVFVEGEQTGVMTATLSILAAGGRNGRRYRCKVSNAAGDVYSKSATLTITGTPVITKHPTDVNIGEGDTATFSVTATGAGLSYQWQFAENGYYGPWSNLSNGSNISGAKAATFSIVTKKEDHGYYRCVVSNAAGSVNSVHAILSVFTKSVEVYGHSGFQLRAGEPGSITFPVVTTGIAPGTYPVTFEYATPGITFPATLTTSGVVNGASGELTLTGTTATVANDYHQSITIAGLKSNTFMFTVLPPYPTDIVFAQSTLYTWHGKTTSLGMTVVPANAERNGIEWTQTGSFRVSAVNISSAGYGSAETQVSGPENALSMSRQAGYVTLTATAPNGVSKSVTIRTKFILALQAGTKTETFKGTVYGDAYIFTRAKMSDTHTIYAKYGANETEWGYGYANLPLQSDIPNTVYTITSDIPELTVTRSGTNNWVMTRTSANVTKVARLTIKCGDQVFKQDIILREE